MPPQKIDAQKLTGLISQLRPDELKTFGAALYHMRQGPGVDTSQFDQPLVQQAIDAYQSVVAAGPHPAPPQAPAGERAWSALKSVGSGLLGYGEAMLDPRVPVIGNTHMESGKVHIDPHSMLGATLSGLPEMQQRADQLRASGHPVEGAAYSLASYLPGAGPIAAGIGEMIGRHDYAGAATTAAGLIAAGKLTDVALGKGSELLRRSGAGGVGEVPGEQLGRQTPLTTTGKDYAGKVGPYDQATAPIPPGARGSGGPSGLVGPGTAEQGHVPLPRTTTRLYPTREVGEITPASPMPSGREGVSESPVGGGTMGAGEALQAPVVQQTPKAVKAFTGLPEARLQPPEPEVKPLQEMTHQAQAEAVAQAPNPGAMPERRLAAEVPRASAEERRAHLEDLATRVWRHSTFGTPLEEPLESGRDFIQEARAGKPTMSREEALAADAARRGEAPLEKPVYPGKGATLEQKQAYAAARDRWMAQQAKLRPKAPKPTDLAGKIDASVKRLAKSRSAAESDTRIGEIHEHAQAIEALPPEERAKLAESLRSKGKALLDQAAENRRAAAAPEQMQALAEAKGRTKLTGEWGRQIPTAEQIAEAKEAGEPRPMTRMVNLEEVPEAERDIYHKLLGHPTTEVLKRDESGRPVELSVNSEQEAAELGAWAEQTKGRLADTVKQWEERGYPPTPEEVDQAAELKDALDHATGLREKLAKTGPRKGMPVVTPEGVVKAPGAVPDIRRETGNLLTGKPEGAHFKRPSPEKLRSTADRMELAAVAYEQLAKRAEGGHEQIKAPEPNTAKQVAEKLAPAAPKSEPIAAPAPSGAQRVASVFDAEGNKVGERLVVPSGATPAERTSQALRDAVGKEGLEAELGRINKQLEGRLTPKERERLLDTKRAYERALNPPAIGLDTDLKAMELFGKPFEELTREQKLKTKPKAEPKQPIEIRPWSEGFPMGEVSEPVRAAVDKARALANPEAVGLISQAVRDQGLATREGAYKLFGRALATYLKAKPDDPLALRRALDVAQRKGELGMIHANFLADIFRGIREKTTAPDVSPVGSTKGALRQYGAERVQMAAHVAELLKDMRKHFADLPLEQQFEFQKHMQAGNWNQFYAPDSPEYKFAAQGRQLLDVMRQRIQAAAPGRLEEFDENYFPQRWEGIHDMYNYVKRTLGAKAPLRGRMSLLRQKYHANLQAGWDAGLRPRFYNPADAILNVVGEAEHFIMGQRVLNELHDRGLLARNVGSPRDVPEGWAPLNPKVAGLGNYAPADLAKMWNRFFNPGIFGDNPTVDTIRMYNSLAQQAAVSLSGFHVGLVSWANFTTDMALTSQYLASGKPFGAMRAFARGITGPLDSYLRGRDSGFLDRFIKTPGGLNQWKMAGAPGAEVQGWLRAYLEGGGRPSGWTDFKDAQAFQHLQRSWQAFGDSFRGTPRIKPLDTIRATAKLVRDTVPAFLRVLSYPVQEGFVKPVKLGSTMKMLEYEMERIGPNATEAERRKAFSEVVDAADDRYGQMIHDNLFWNRTYSDLANLAFKFVDFNYGTLRAMYGAVPDVARAATGGGLTHRLAFALAAPASLALLGAMTNYMLTGEGPKSAEDYYFPRNGKTGPDGKPERVILPTYLRAAYEWAMPAAKAAQGQPREAIDAAMQAAKGRLAPVVDLLHDWKTNRDFMGNVVVNKDDPVIQQYGEFLRSFTNQMQPISFGAWQRSSQLGGGLREKILSLGGVQPVPRSLGLDQTPAELELQRQLREYYGEGYAAPEILAHERAINRLVVAERNHTGDFAQIWREEYGKGNIRGADLDTVMQRLQKPYMDRVSELPLPRQVAVLEKAETPAERAEIMQSISAHLDKLWEMPESQRKALWDRISAAQRKPLQPAQQARLRGSNRQPTAR